MLVVYSEHAKRTDEDATVTTRHWERELIPAMSGMAWQLAAGTLLKVVDVEGGQTGDVFAVAADDLEDGLSNGRRSTTVAVSGCRRGRSCTRGAADPC
jgi:uncharacterized protein YcgI (DUF1989 family)